MKTNLSNKPKLRSCVLEDWGMFAKEYAKETQRWFADFEAELREKLAEATKEWDDLGLICADLRRDFIRELLGEMNP